jgi:hypothetical protein
MNARHLLAALGLVLALPFGCRGVLGVGEHVAFDCPSYCSSIADRCSGRPQFASQQVCEAYCGKLPQGDVNEIRADNSSLCRENALFANDASGAAVDCVGAGPRGSIACGHTCANFCQGLQLICGDEFGKIGGGVGCLADCKQLADCGAYQSDTAGNAATIQCRLFHLSAAANDPVQHCRHAAGRDSQTCGDPAPPQCKTSVTD